LVDDDDDSINFFGEDMKTETVRDASKKVDEHMNA
jgi:hypothetical protein